MKGWKPIGTATSNGVTCDGVRFNAIFEGNDYTITGLAIRRSQRIIGMFGTIETNANIRNIGLIDNLADYTGISSVAYVGGLVDQQYGHIFFEEDSSGIYLETYVPPTRNITTSEGTLNVLGTTYPTGVNSAMGLTSMNVNMSSMLWNKANKNTLGAWNFATGKILLSTTLTTTVLILYTIATMSCHIPMQKFLCLTVPPPSLSSLDRDSISSRW